jgi:CheY-like chemotaxis protein
MSICLNDNALTSQNTKNRILVVDDEPDITLTLKAGLETVGLFDVDAFNDPESALKSFKSDNYALVLIDIMMPKMSGFELYEQLKKVDPDIKVCFLTARLIAYVYPLLLCRVVWRLNEKMPIKKQSHLSQSLSTTQRC